MGENWQSPFLTEVIMNTLQQWITSIFDTLNMKMASVSPFSLRSSQVNNGIWLFFSRITFDRGMLEQWKHLSCVWLVETDRLICNLTLTGQVMTLTWGQIFKLIFQDQVIIHSTRLNERITMLVKESSCKVWVKSNCKKTVSEKNRLFWEFLPPGGKTVAVGQIWEDYSERALIGL